MLFIIPVFLLASVYTILNEKRKIFLKNKAILTVIDMNSSNLEIYAFVNDEKKFFTNKKKNVKKVLNEPFFIFSSSRLI